MFAYVNCDLLSLTQTWLQVCEGAGLTYSKSLKAINNCKRTKKKKRKKKGPLKLAYLGLQHCIKKDGPKIHQKGYKKFQVLNKV